MHANLELLLSRLEKVKRNGDQSWMACCPAHDDKDPSMAVTVTDAGKVLLKCFCGCSAPEIMGALGLPMSVLFHPESRKYSSNTEDLRKRMRDRQFMRDIAKDAMVVAMAASHIRNGDKCTDEDVELLIQISTSMEQRAKEYLG